MHLQERDFKALSMNHTIYYYMSSEESPRMMKNAIGEVKGVVQEVKEGILATVDETREVAATVRVRPVRRAVKRRIFGTQS